MALRVKNNEGFIDGTIDKHIRTILSSVLGGGVITLFLPGLSTQSQRNFIQVWYTRTLRGRSRLNFVIDTAKVMVHA